MNEILKFKEGRKVGKYQNPAGPLEPTSSNPWQEYYTNVYTPNGGVVAPTSQRAGRANRSSVTYRERQRREAQGAYNAQVRAGLRNPAEDMIPIWLRKPAEQVAPAVEQQTGGGTGGRTGGRVRGRVTPRVDYAAKFSGMNFTDAEKDFITKAGFDPTNAKSVQEFILSRAAGANLGARKGAGIADGYWGDKSAAAFQALRNQGIFNPVDATDPVKTVEEKPIDAPDYGYTTTNHYGNGRELKNMGFSNYAGLQKFAAGNDQFAKDLRQRFGQDVTKWDQAAVEGALGVSGRYRGSRSGDFGDMARSMQQWAAHQNLMHDINERWDRTGADGTEYSSREMREKFDNIKVSPEIKYGGGTKFDFSGMKFNTGFTGANTLGGAGATLGGGLSLGGNLSLGGGEIGGNPADNDTPANNMKQAKYADK